MKVIEFIFGDFWHWLGALIFLVVIVDGFFVNLFRIINNAVIHKRHLPKSDPKELPSDAPDGVIWPYDGRYFIRVDGIWNELGDNIKNHETEKEKEL